MKLKIKKGDTVQVTAGAQKGVKGTVMTVNRKAMKITVQGVKVMTHFDKQEGLKKIEAPIDYSNVKLVEKASKEAKKPTAKKTKAAARK